MEHPLDSFETLIYGLKQSRRMWYNRLSEYLISQGYENNELCPCVFIQKSHFRFGSLYYMSITWISFGTLEELEKTTCEMKDPEKTRFCPGLELKHCVNGIPVPQLITTSRYCDILIKIKRSFCTLMVVHTLDAAGDPFRLMEDRKRYWSPKFLILVQLRFIVLG